MLAVPTIDLLLLDFDGLLVRYCHRTRLRELAARAGTDTARIQQQLFDSGLERAHDGGGLDSDGYLRQLHARLPHRLSRQDWLQARLAATTLQPGMLTLLEQAARQRPLALLSNNNAWLSELLMALSPDLPPLFEGRVLSSAALGQRKPTARAFLHAVQQLQLQPQRVLFVDDLFVNVRGARQAGLHAETAADSASLSRILRRYRLL